jgi:serine/threonine protein kinase
MPPECFNGAEYYPKPMDCWALGASIYAFHFGQLPFEGSSEDEIKEAICEQPLNFPEECSQELKDVLIALLDKSPVTRATIEEMT